MLLGSESILAETEFVLNLVMGHSFHRSIWWWLFCHCWYCSSHWTLWEALVILKEDRCFSLAADILYS